MFEIELILLAILGGVLGIGFQLRRIEKRLKILAPDAARPPPQLVPLDLGRTRARRSDPPASNAE